MQTKTSSIYLLGCLLAGSMIFTSCSKDESLPLNQENSSELKAFDRSCPKAFNSEEFSRFKGNDSSFEQLVKIIEPASRHPSK